MKQARVEAMMIRMCESEGRRDLREKLKGLYPTGLQVRSLFDRFNRLYFDGALLGWRVKLAGRPWLAHRPWRPAPAPDVEREFEVCEALMGQTDHSRKIIYIRLGLIGDELERTLVHEMVHAKLGKDEPHDGPNFFAEHRRIAAARSPAQPRAQHRMNKKKAPPRGCIAGAVTHHSRGRT